MTETEDETIQLTELAIGVVALEAVDLWRQTVMKYFGPTIYMILK